MLAGDERAGDRTRRADEVQEAGVRPEGRGVRVRGLVVRGRRVAPLLVLLGLVAGAPTCSWASAPGRNLVPINTSRTRGAHSEAPAQPLIEQVEFNHRALPFEKGVTAGPGAGDLEIRFAASATDEAEPLRYRLIGFDREWKEAGKEREAAYPDLGPGRYELEFARSSGAVVAGSLAITVSPLWWQTPWARGLCVIFLLFVVFALHRLRVDHLVRHTHKLQGMVNQTKAELTLAVKTAGDAQEALKEQALKDSLTGLWTRREVFAKLEREAARAQRDHFPLTLLMIDLDHFKNINDTHGHLTGDEVLRETAGRLMETMRPYDFAGRYGGEEFLVVLPSCSRHNGARRAEDFRCALSERLVPTAAGPLAVTCSVGMAVYDEAMTLEELLHRADAALYHAKREGRNCVCVAQTKIAAGSESGRPAHPGQRRA